jgi:hypothetical protein
MMAMRMATRKGRLHRHGALVFQEFEQWMPFTDPITGKRIGRGAGLRIRLRPWAPKGLATTVRARALLRALRPQAC